MTTESHYRTSTGRVEFPATERLAAFRAAKTGDARRSASYKLIRPDGSPYKSSRKETEAHPRPSFTRYSSITKALQAKRAAEANGEPTLTVDLA